METTLTAKPRPPTELLQYSLVPKTNSFSNFKLSAPQRRIAALSIYTENRKVNETVERLKTKESKFGKILKSHSVTNKLFAGQLTTWMENSRSLKVEAVKRENTRITDMLKNVKSEYRGIRT